MARRKSKKKGGAIKKVILLVILIGGIFAAFFVYDLYKKVYAPNVYEHNGFDFYLFIPTDASYEDVVHILKNRRIIKNEASFRWVAEKMNYPNNINAGKYIIKPSMNNRSLISLLRSGEQKPVKLVIRKHRTTEDLVSHVSGELEADSTVLTNLLNDQVFLRQYGLNPSNVFSIFIANTYEFYWNTNATGFFERMIKEYKRFWTEDRVHKAKQLGLSPLEVITLASIVEEETYRANEKSRIAGVYLNRVKKGMRLEADPTVKYAVGDFTLKRILKVHTRVESPYNTYRNKGLPPGPICIPSLETIEAALNAEQHNYLYFCANADFSGNHNFAATYSQHLANARAYRAELNKRKIR